MTRIGRQLFHTILDDSNIISDRVVSVFAVLRNQNVDSKRTK